MPNAEISVFIDCFYPSLGSGFLDIFKGIKTLRLKNEMMRRIRILIQPDDEIVGS